MELSREYPHFYTIDLGHKVELLYSLNKPETYYSHIIYLLHVSLVFKQLIQ